MKKALVLPLYPVAAIGILFVLPFAVLGELFRYGLIAVAAVRYRLKDALHTRPT